MFIDTHCHLDSFEFDQDRDAVITRARENGIGGMINIGSSLKGSQESLELARKYDVIWASVGIHPHEADKFNAQEEKILGELARQDKVVAIGEIGLDYYRNYSSGENQKKLFLTLVKLAIDLKLPLVIHTRQAQADTLDILKRFSPLPAVIHCFSGDENFLKECLDLGFFISFTCNITYRKAEDLRKVVKLLPLDKLMLETDAPFLSPEGMRGKRNEPLYVKPLAEEIARIKGVSVAEIEKITTENAQSFFRLRSLTSKE